MEERDLKILRHIGRYHVSLRGVIEDRFFDGRKTACGQVLDRLRRTTPAPLITSHRVLGRGMTYYRLTGAAASMLGLSESRARRVFDGQNLLKNLSTLWFCNDPKTPRRRLEAEELTSLFGGTPPPGLHVLENASRKRLWRVYVPNVTTERRTIRKEILSELREALAHSKASLWIEQRLYGFAILVSSTGKAEMIKAFLQGRGKENKDSMDDNGVPLKGRAEFLVELVPDFIHRSPRQSLNALPAGKIQHASEETGHTNERP